MSHCSGTAQVSTSLLGAGTMYGPPPVQSMTRFAGESVPVFGDAAMAATVINSPPRTPSADLGTMCSSRILVLTLPHLGSNATAKSKPCARKWEGELLNHS